MSSDHRGSASHGLFRTFMFLVGLAVAVPVRAQQRVAQPDTAASRDTAEIALAERRRIAIARTGETVVVEHDRNKTQPSDKQDRGRRAQKSGVATTNTRHVGRMFFDIPEYHDEQPFPLDGGRYGPMVYLYASPFLGEFRRMADIVEQGKYGAFAAVIDVDAGLDTELPAPYAALHLQPGVNCLWIANVTGSANGWTAWVTRADPLEGCLRPKDPAAGEPPIPSLHVIPSFPAGAAHDDYPAVARFSEARFNAPARFGQPLIGVKCLAGWCEIGPAGFALRSVPTSMGGRYARVKGWHDEQLLGHKVAGTLQQAVRATIIPDPQLANYGLASFPITMPDQANLARGWLPVATIILENDPPVGSKYAHWGLRRGENFLFLRRVGPDSETDWQMSVIPVSGGQRHIWTNVRREPHTDVLVPPTARWRFASFDPDGVWVRCGEACCSGDGGIS